jgi:nitroreductase
MELLEAIKGRRSIRSFKKQDVPDDIVAKLIEAARWAPSAGNIQPWQFVIVRKPDVKRRLSEAALNQAFIEEAPVFIVVCADEKRSSMGYGLRGKALFCLQDTAAATQNILLTAYSLGFGTCWVGAFDEGMVRAALNIPEGMRPVAMVPVGCPNESPRPRSRRPLSDIVHYDVF